MKKRLLSVLSVILTFLMLGSTFSFAANVAPVSSDKFTDVDAEAWYFKYVDWITGNNTDGRDQNGRLNNTPVVCMNGTSETTFEPQTNLTRAMFATILARYDKADVDDSKATIFQDVLVNEWYTGSIGWANEKEIVKGYGDGNFGTMDDISRQDLSLMIIRYIRYYEKTHNVTIKTHGGEWNGDITFTDEDQIRQDEETPQAIKDLVNYGILLGYPDGTVKPTQKITRAETAAIIYRLNWILPTSPGGGGSTAVTNDYVVTAALTGPDTLNVPWPVTLQKTYKNVSNTGTNDVTIDVVIKDLVTGENEILINNGIQAILDDLDYVHNKTVDVNGVTYEVNLDPETKNVTATKDGVAVTDWDAQLKVEQDLYEKRMAEFGEAAMVAEAGAEGEWNTFVEALSPENLMNAAPEYLQFKEQADYLKAVQDAAINAGIVLKKLGDNGFKESYDSLVAYMASAPLGIDLSGYTIDATELTATTDETSGKMDAAMKKKGILVPLTNKGKDEYVALYAQESVTRDGLLDTINQRTSRAWVDSPEGVAAIVAFLEANMADVNSKFFGNYELKVTVAKK